MKYHYQSTQRMASIITITCLLLFIAYSISLFIRHQSYTIALANFVANGCVANMAHESADAAWIAALLGTSLCVIPALLLFHSLHFPISMKGLALLPSYVVLGLMTGIAPASADAVENDIPVFSALLLMLISVLAIFAGQLYHEDKGEHSTFARYLGGNVFLSCIGIMFCMSITNTDRGLHLQQPLAKSILHHDYSVAESIPVGETVTNNTITALRALSLSRQGQMADRLFSIRGLHGSRSLMPDSTPSSLIYNTPQLVYNQLQAIPVGFNGNVSAFLHKALVRRMQMLQDSTASQADSIKSRPLIDYYLCALLLDRELSLFAQALPKYYNVRQPLPRHYDEALTICRTENIQIPHAVPNTQMDSIYNDYQQLRLNYQENISSQRKACVETYPRTYWNYYHFGLD